MTVPQLLPPPASILDDASLFLDFDGTLVELAERPDAVVVDDTLGALLVRLAERLDGRIGIVSGRSIAQIDGFLGRSLDRFAVVGSHGAEIRRVGAAIERPDRPPALVAAEVAFTERFVDRPPVVIEVKSLGVAIHYRQLPEAEAEATALVEAFAAREGFEVQHGKMMTELRMAGHDKGTAIAALAGIAPFQGHPPVFVGDDLTDETGFVAASRHGGAGILIGPDRDTAAAHRLPDVAAFLRWLENAL